MSEIKYLTNGAAVRVVANDGDGFIVRIIFTPNDDADNDFELDHIEDCTEGEDFFYGDPIFAERVFDAPPVQHYHDEVDQLKNEIISLRNKKVDLEKEITALVDRHAETVKKFGMIPELKHLQDYIDGKITHLVIEHWGHKFNIVEFSDFINYQEKRWNRKPGLKLMVLFGNTNGDLQWEIYDYPVESGSSLSVYPCISLGEAQSLRDELHKKRLSERIQKAITDKNIDLLFDLYKEAKKIGIPNEIPRNMLI